MNLLSLVNLAGLVPRPPAPIPQLTPEEEAEEAAQAAHGNRPLSPEDIASPARVVERLSCADEEIHEHLLREAGITRHSCWPDHKTRCWSWERPSWELADERGPYLHPSWEGEALFFDESFHWPGYEVAEWRRANPELNLPEGWEIWGEPGTEYVRYR